MVKKTRNRVLERVELSKKLADIEEASLGLDLPGNREEIKALVVEKYLLLYGFKEDDAGRLIDYYINALCWRIMGEKYLNDGDDKMAEGCKTKSHAAFIEFFNLFKILLDEKCRK